MHYWDMTDTTEGLIGLGLAIANNDIFSDTFYLENTHKLFALKALMF